MKNWISAVAVNFEPRVVAVFFLGFSSGLPLLLILSTLSLWLSEEGVSKTTIGLFSLVGTAYALKYLWSPLVDRLPLPPLTTLLGRRRGWLIFSQLAVIVAIIGLGSTEPKVDLWQTAMWAVILAFASATQDIVIDAFRIEILDERQLGAGASNVVLGYRVGMLAAGAGALFAAEAYGWHGAYYVMAALMAVSMITVFLVSEPVERTSPASAEREAKLNAFLHRFDGLPSGLRSAAAWVYGAVICPFAEFMLRPGWLAVLLFVALYKYADALLGVMANPFYAEMGFTKPEIAEISKIWGLAMTLSGGVIGGVMIARWGIMKTLLLCCVLQGASNLMYVAQAYAGHDIPMLSATIAIENLTGGMGTTAFVAYLSSLCNIAYTATQYALLSSFAVFARTFMASAAGWLAENLGWVDFFLLSTAGALPGLLLLLWMMRKFRTPESMGGARPALAEGD